MALEQLGQALAAFEALGSRDEAARVLRILSQVHEALDDLGAALACVRKAGAIEQALRRPRRPRAARGRWPRARRLDQARLETERYRRLAMEDSLTGLANRRQLDERLRALMREARKAGSVVTVALADVDHFKGINDRFSHAVGDEVLRCVGEILRAPLPPGRPRGPLRRRGVHAGVPQPRDTRRPPRSASACAARSRAGTGSRSIRSCA